MLDLGIVFASATAIAALLYRVWDRSWSVVYHRDPDVQIISEIVKTIDRHGWYLRNPDVGAPFGQQLYDFPHGGETLQLAAIRVLGLATDRFGVIVNVYYLLGFGILAAVTFAVLRHLRFSRGIAGAVSLLYTFLPYHFAHGEGHLFRSSYFSAPIAALLMLWVLTFRTTFLHSPDASTRPGRALRANLRWRRVTVAVLLCAVVALTETMTVAFVLTATVSACILVAIRDRSVAQLVSGLLVAGLVALVFALALAPNLLHSLEHGSNEVAARRTIAEQEWWGLRISQMVLPPRSHRLPAARHLTARANRDAPVLSEPGQELGVLGTIGFLVMIGTALVKGIPRRTRVPVDDRDQLVRLGGLLSLVLILFAVVSGLAVALDLMGFTQIRVWNRVVVLIAFYAFVTLAVWFERAGRWLAYRSRHASTLMALALVVLVGAGLWDTTAQRLPPGDNPIVSPVRTFDAALERRLPSGSALFQLPVVPFPEAGPRYRMKDYDGFLPYLWSDHLRWSYGATRGRPEGDWQQRVDSEDPVPSLAGLAGLGYAGIVVDTAGYDKRGTSVVADLTEVLGPPSVTSPTRRWRFWDLRDWASSRTEAELRAGARRLAGSLADRHPSAP